MEYYRKVSSHSRLPFMTYGQKIYSTRRNNIHDDILPLPDDEIIRKIKNVKYLNGGKSFFCSESNMHHVSTCFRQKTFSNEANN